jgi:hypothetical protein
MHFANARISSSLAESSSSVLPGLCLVSCLGPSTSIMIAKPFFMPQIITAVSNLLNQPNVIAEPPVS